MFSLVILKKNVHPKLVNSPNSWSHHSPKKPKGCVLSPPRNLEGWNHGIVISQGSMLLNIKSPKTMVQYCAAPVNLLMVGREKQVNLQGPDPLTVSWGDESGYCHHHGRGEASALSSSYCTPMFGENRRLMIKISCN